MTKKNIFKIELRSKDGENGEVKRENQSDAPADFEKAITAAGFGKFNFLLYVIAITSGWSSIFETTTMSYVFPAAECDLDLQLEHKGLLNAITYIGMISSAFIWGFLCDTLGRKKLLVIGFLLDALSVIFSASSQNFGMLLTGKFLGGFIINGPFAALTTYLSEFHCAKHRARVQMILGVTFSAGSLVLPILALGVLPKNLRLEISEYFVIHSWNIYLFICSLAPLISGIAFIFLPESPKFLMTIGQNKKAMEVFRKVYHCNTGNPPSTYPIEKLVEEIELNKANGKRVAQVTANRSNAKALQEGWQQLKPLFLPPHLLKIILVCCIQFMTILSLNTLRLWLPQIFQAINDYTHNNNQTASLCEMMDVFRPKDNINTTEEIICTVNFDNYNVYINSIIVASTTIGGYVIAGSLINILGKKKLLSILGITSGSMAMSLYFARNSPTTVALSALFVANGSVAINVVLAVVVDLFPTTLRTMTVSLTMMIGRTGAIMGNLIFPLLLSTGCAPPFFFVGSAMIACAVLACLLPNTDQKALI